MNFIHLINHVVTQAALQLIRFYQRFLSPLKPPACRFQPTCSHYTYQAIERFGFWRGLWLGLRRLCRCHPLHPRGYDWVPQYWGQKVPFEPETPPKPEAPPKPETPPKARSHD